LAWGEKALSSKWNLKAGISTKLITDKVDCNSELVSNDKEVHFIFKKETITLRIDNN
jgi:hypothetical protein